jgi:hypothetical protein
VIARRDGCEVGRPRLPIRLVPIARNRDVASRKRRESFWVVFSLIALHSPLGL